MGSDSDSGTDLGLLSDEGLEGLEEEADMDIREGETAKERAARVAKGIREKLERRRKAQKEQRRRLGRRDKEGVRKPQKNA